MKTTLSILTSALSVLSIHQKVCAATTVPLPGSDRHAHAILTTTADFKSAFMERSHAVAFQYSSFAIDHPTHRSEGTVSALHRLGVCANSETTLPLRNTNTLIEPYGQTGAVPFENGFFLPSFTPDAVTSNIFAKSPHTVNLAGIAPHRPLIPIVANFNQNQAMLDILSIPPAIGSTWADAGPGSNQ